MLFYENFLADAPCGLRGSRPWVVSQKSKVGICTKYAQKQCCDGPNFLILRNFLPQGTHKALGAQKNARKSMPIRVCEIKSWNRGILHEKNPERSRYFE